MRIMRIRSTVLCLALLMTGLLCGCSGGQTGDGAEKQVTITVTAGEDVREFSYTTTASTLRALLEEQGMVKGRETQYGLFVTEVCGIAADESAEQWWCFTQNGERLLTGVDDTALTDGDRYGITLMTGYD